MGLIQRKIKELIDQGFSVFYLVLLGLMVGAIIFVMLAYFLFIF